MKHRKEILLIFLILFILSLVSFITPFYGHIDIGDYADVAKFFAGDYAAKIRTSHSTLYGLIHAPLISLIHNFWILKLSSIFFLSLIIISTYLISNKNKYALLLILFSPIIWYMGPWINPIQISSLFFLWGCFFIEKYQFEKKPLFLVYSGILLGISGSFWESAFYFAGILFLCFLIDKKFNHLLLFILGFFLGMLPKLVVDQIFFGFAFYSIFKHFFAVASSILYGGIYDNPNPGHRNFLDIFLVLLMVPTFFYLTFKRKIWNKYKRNLIFFFLSILLIIFISSQIRYLLIIAPIMTLFLAKVLTKEQLKIQISIFIIFIVIISNLYLIQLKYPNFQGELSSFANNIKNPFKFYETQNILEDFKKIEQDYSNQIFIVGPLPDDYQKLAHLYWGDKIKEFISLQDYELFIKNSSIISQKEICSKSLNWNRRDICIGISLKKTIQDETDYSSIKHALWLDNNMSLKDFSLEKKYSLISIYKKKS